ncbi:hypothetical protein [Streptomyces sp. S186]|uniref:hypothetical protein n=1 Tax=Streptomyces sp. S186 TaxID=3434395 RepID=UPI003F66DF7F
MTSTVASSTKPSLESEPLRGHTAELTADQLGGFEVRWYDHNGGRRVGPFDRMDEVALYMAEHDLGAPDELLAPVDPGR